MAPTGAAGLICPAWTRGGGSQVRRPAGACHPFNQRREMALTIVETRAITGGVDTHADTHVAAALDPIGGLLGVREVPVTPAGYAGLLDWLGGVGAVAPGGGDVTGYATRIALRELGRRAEFLDGQLERPGELIVPLVTARAPGLLALYGIGPHTAALLLIAAGDHPGRLRSEAAWAHLCAAAPIPASSGKVTRHRLNPGGDRQANHALWRIVFTRMGSYAPPRPFARPPADAGELRGRPDPIFGCRTCWPSNDSPAVPGLSFPTCWP